MLAARDQLGQPLFLRSSSRSGIRRTPSRALAAMTRPRGHPLVRHTFVTAKQVGPNSVVWMCSDPGVQTFRAMELAFMSVAGIYPIARADDRSALGEIHFFHKKGWGVLAGAHPVSELFQLLLGG